MALIRILVHVQPSERLILSIPILRCHPLIEISQLQVLLRLLDICRRVLLLRVLGSTWPRRWILVEFGARAMTRLLLAMNKVLLHLLRVTLHVIIDGHSVQLLLIHHDFIVHLAAIFPLMPEI